MSQKLYIGLVIGGSAFCQGRRTFGNVAKIFEEPKSRREVADELFTNLDDAITNCDEDFIDVVAYKNDFCNITTFRITDKNEHGDDLIDLKMKLIDGNVDIINIKPKSCFETVYSIVPVHGEC